jgi:hypothetical protein
MACTRSQFQSILEINKEIDYMYTNDFTDCLSEHTIRLLLKETNDHGLSFNNILMKYLPIGYVIKNNMIVKSNNKYVK